jgi:hypothetical protein
MEKVLSRGVRITLLVYTAYSVVFGLIHISRPKAFGAVDPAIGRVLGAAFLAFALGAWFAYQTRHWKDARYLVLVQLVWMILYAITMVWGLLTGEIVLSAWPSAIVGTVFAVVLLIFYIKEG